MTLLLKVLLLVCLVSVVLCQSHHFEMGQKLRGDRQLHYEIVRKRSQPLRKVTKDVQFPPKGSVPGARIHYVKALDQYSDDSGGYVTIIEGGLNQTSITLHFKSKRGHGFNFLLEVWGQ